MPGEGWGRSAIFTCKQSFCMQLLLQIIFCVSPSSCKHFYLLVYNLFQCLQPCKQFILQFSNRPPSPSKNNGPPLKIKPCRYSVRADFLLSSFASTGKSFGKKGKTARGSELKSKEQILKARHRKEKMMQRQNKGRPRGKGNKGKFGRKKWRYWTRENITLSITPEDKPIIAEYSFVVRFHVMSLGKAPY